MAEIQLHPEHGGDPIDVPSDKITIGRGAFMKVTDKRVSRNHATLEINNNRELIITPIHTNPCFMKVKSTGEKLTLAKDKPQILRNGDLLGLLPDSLYFRVVYKGQDNGEVETSDTETESCQQNEDKSNDKTTVKENKPVLSNNTENEDTKQATEENAVTVKCGQYEVALPLKKTRVLPKWMIGAAKRVSLNSQEPSTDNAPSKRRIATNARTSQNNQVLDSEEEESKPTPNKRRRSAPRKRAVQESDEEDWADEEPPRSRQTKTRRKPGSESDNSAKRKRRRRRRYDNDSEEESEQEEVQIKKREPRMSAQKLLTYKDEFDLGEVGLSSSESEVGGQFGSWKKDDDSDFVIDDLDSGSDWEMSHSQSSRRGKRKGRTRSVTQTRGRRKSARKGRRQNYNDSDFDDDDEDDVYVPRPSRRRSSNSKHQKRAIDEEDSDEKKSRMKKAKRKLDDRNDSDDEDDDDGGDEKPEPKKKRQVINDDSTSDSDLEGSKRKQKTTCEKNNKTNKSENDEESESDEDVETRHKSRRPCMYGKKCYRKNPLHFKEFCHPGDSSYDEVDPNDDKKDKPKRELRQKDKKSILRGDSDDEGEPNTYDYEDSFLTREGSDMDPTTSSEESEWSPEEENVRSLVKEAKGFIRNRKMQRPARNK